jgi:hypothetical protein
VNRYDARLDRLITHDGAVACRGNGMIGFVLDEMELGARVALALDESDQWWWELIGNRLAVEA